MWQCESHLSHLHVSGCHVLGTAMHGNVMLQCCPETATLYCLQVSDVDVAGEPEARRVARAKRLAEQQRRIAEQVAAQQAAAVAEAAAKEQRGSIRDQLKPRIEQWQAGKKVRASNLNPVSCNLL